MASGDISTVRTVRFASQGEAAAGGSGGGGGMPRWIFVTHTVYSVPAVKQFAETLRKLAVRA